MIHNKTAGANERSVPEKSTERKKERQSQDDKMRAQEDGFREMPGAKSSRNNKNNGYPDDEYNNMPGLAPKTYADKESEATGKGWKSEETGEE